MDVDQACCQVAPDACQAYDKRRRSVFVYWVFLISDDGADPSPTFIGEAASSVAYLRRWLSDARKVPLRWVGGFVLTRLA